jgi:AcrR family transcriptional regulator
MGVTERQAREKQQRIDSILRAAKHLFAEKGYQETSMQDIAAASELGKATIYYYFPTKEAIYQNIFLTCTRTYYQSIEQDVTAHSSLEGVLRAMITGFLNQADRDPEFIKLLYPVGRNAPVHLIRAPEIVAQTEALRAPLEHHLNQILQEHHTRQDPRTVAHLIWSFLSGLGHKIVAGESRRNLTAVIELFIASLTSYLETY